MLLLATPLARAVPLIQAIIAVITIHRAGGLEYCFTDSFSAKCSPGQVILMTSARFGRLQVGRCMTRNYGYEGCSVDVLAEMDRYCSGRRKCELSVSDPVLVRKKPCPKDFSSYLDANFKCVAVPMKESWQCKRSAYQALTGTSGYIANIVSDETGCGTSTAPWVIQALPGQKVNITLLDFGFIDRMQNYTQLVSTSCTKYASVQEDRKKTQTICGSSQRESLAYLSSSNHVSIHIMQDTQRTNENSKFYFMLKYDVVGCADPPSPADAWVSRKGDTLKVTCNHTGEASFLRCIHNEWKGQLRNCSKPPISGNYVNDFGLPPIGISIVIILGVALVVVVYVAIMITCVLYIQRIRRRRRNSRASGRDSRLDGGKDDPRHKIYWERKEEISPMLYRTTGKAGCGRSTRSIDLMDACIYDSDKLTENKNPQHNSALKDDCTCAEAAGQYSSGSMECGCSKIWNTGFGTYAPAPHEYESPRRQLQREGKNRSVKCYFELATKNSPVHIRTEAVDSEQAPDVLPSGKTVVNNGRVALNTSCSNLDNAPPGGKCRFETFAPLHVQENTL